MDMFHLIVIIEMVNMLMNSVSFSVVVYVKKIKVLNKVERLYETI